MVWRLLVLYTKKIEDSFSDPETPSPECYKYITCNWLGECHMFDKGLCLLHKEKGPAYLPSVCRLYPRSLKSINNQLIACCSSSCEEVVEQLYNLKDFKMTKIELEEDAQIKYSLNEDLINDINHYNDVLKNNNTSLSKRIETICLEINKDEYYKEYDKNINPIKEALKILDNFINKDEFLDEIINLLKTRYLDNPDQYINDRNSFEVNFPNWINFFENVINNSMVYLCFPFADERIDKSNAIKGLCVTYGLLRFVTIGYTSVNKNVESLIDSTSELFRLIEHTPFYYNISIISKNAAVLLDL